MCRDRMQSRAQSRRAGPQRLAERMGLQPDDGGFPPLAGARLRPLGHLSAWRVASSRAGAFLADDAGAVFERWPSQSRETGFAPCSPLRSTSISRPWSSIRLSRRDETAHQIIDDFGDRRHLPLPRRPSERCREQRNFVTCDAAERLAGGIAVPGRGRDIDPWRANAALHIAPLASRTPLPSTTSIFL